MKRPHKFICLLIIVSIPCVAHAQRTVENSIFWEVSGNGITEPSYLFGTFHILGQDHVDSLSNVNAAFELSRHFISEVNFDSTQILKLAFASVMKDSTLDQLLTPQAYEDLAAWLRELSGYDIAILNKMNPLTIQMLVTNLLQQRIYGKVEVPMDMHFEAKAKVAGKTVSALETMDEQLKTLFSMSYKRQAAILEEYIRDKERAIEQLIELNTVYRQQDLGKMEVLSNAQFTTEEIHVMLNNRNDNWMKILPAQIQEGSVFIAVGAMHLAGEKGIVNQLRRLGYIVNPLPLR